MQAEYDPNIPIYLQIMRRISYKILRGEYKPGDKLPSWVDAGLEYNVNHNTIARTYLEMARANLVETRRGEGTFVTSDVNVLNELHESLKQERLEEFVTEMSRLGYTLPEIDRAFHDYIAKLTIDIADLNQDVEK